MSKADRDQAPLHLWGGDGGGADACPRPELLQANQVTDSTARLTWSDVGDQYEVEIAAGTDPFTGIPTYVVNADPPFDVAGLTPGRNYRFQVRTVCDDTTSSVWSTPRSFITDLNNARPCPLNLDLRDTSCNNIQVFELHVDEAPGSALGTDVLLRGVRMMIEHPWRSDLSVWLVSPDSTRIQLIGGLNAGDQNIGDLQGAVCAQFVELTDDAAVAQPLSSAAETDNITGYYLPVQTLAGLHTGANPVGVWRVEICDNKVAHRGKLRLFELVFARADCPPVENVAANNVTENAADISWQTDATGDSLLIEYGPAGFIPGAGNTAGTGGAALLLAQPATPPLSLNGLQTLQWYEVYIRRQCAPGVWGPNSWATRFFTNCSPTLLETAEDLDLCSATNCADPCPLPGFWQNVPDDDYEWKVFTGPGLAWPVAGPQTASGGSGNYLYFRNACSPTGAFGKTAKLRTLCVQVSAPPAQACHFSFDLYQNTKINQPGALMLQASTDGGVNWDTVKTWSGNRGKLWRREYVTLSDYDGQTTLFQFVASGVFGAYGDLAIDNLAFYGSQEAGTPDFEFYLDADGDSFGDPNVRVISCFPAAPPGYVPADSDCDDSDPAVYPGAPEILCNQTDENCNGMADDADIPAPAAPATVEICAGANAVLTASGMPAGQFFWYEKETGGAPIAAGNTLNINHLTSSKTYYLADSLTGPGAGCSSDRVGADVIVHPVPVLTLGVSPTLCDGTPLNLSTLPVNDTANTGGILTYHSATPPGPANQLPSPLIQPGLTTNYYILGTTAFGCTGTKTVTVTVLPSPEVQIVQGDSVNVCRGRTLTLQAQESGVGAPPIEYAWSTGLNFQNIPVQAGNIPNVTKTYTVTVTDDNGCTGTDQIKVHTLNNVTQTALESAQNVSTCGGSDGSITLRPLNGTAPYTLAWPGGTLSGVTGTGTISGLSQGSYRITVTDATNAGCSMVMPQIVLNAPGLDVALDTIIHPACPGASTGSIVLDVNGQNPVFSWSNAQSGSTATNLSAGLYSVTIVDGNCSQVLSNLEVTAPSPIDINVNTLKSVQCFGESNGLIDLAVFGATPPFDYYWSNDATSEDLSNLPAGTYTCTITDAHGCIFESPEYTVAEPPLLNVILDTVQNVRCFGEKSGYLCVEVIGGTGAYQYNWNTGAKTACLSSIGAGIYSVTATDGNACTAEWLGVITQSSALQIEFTLKTNPGCFGAKDGSIELVPTGGTPPIQYHWSNSGNTAKIQNLGVGIYRCTLTDSRGCSLVSPGIILTAPQVLGISLDTLVHVGCRGDATGLIGVSVSGATGNITASWNGITDDLTLSNA
ncbi:MAG: fibronectin type III domain-containing protein, partial [Thermoanaerobaculia bacterium]|nr:fibronectin type III domain-containing protein [Thermoanaerobaculia bacterium]